MDDSYLAFCFDEACYYIMSQYDFKKNLWRNIPDFNDVDMKAANNKSVIDYMLKHS